MADSLLETLGLRPGRLPKVAGPNGRLIDLNLPPDYDPAKAPAAPGKPAKTPADLKLPSDPKQQIDLLAEALKRVKDPVKQDPLVQALRNAISKIPQPFFTQAEFRKKLDEAIDSAIDAGAKALLKAALEAVAGKKATEMPADRDRDPRLPPVEEKDLGQHILKTPPIPVPWDKPKPPAGRAFFEFKGLPKTARAGGYASFTLSTPHWFDPGKFPGTWVVALGADDFKKNRDGARSAKDGTHVDQKGSLKLSLALPDEPGAYVIVVKVQSGYEHDPVEAIVLT